MTKQNAISKLTAAGIPAASIDRIVKTWERARPELRDEIIEVALGAVHAARAASAKGGRSRSAAKQAASKANGAKGGRPAVKGWHLVEDWDRLSDPELSCLVAIIERDGRRVLVTQRRDHEIMPGDWELGVAAELHADDTKAAMLAPWNDDVSTLEAVEQGYDDTRPLLEWSGKTIESIMDNVER